MYLDFFQKECFKYQISHYTFKYFNNCWLHSCNSGIIFFILPELKVGVSFCLRSLHLAPSRFTKFAVNGSLLSSYGNPRSVKYWKSLTKNCFIVSGSSIINVGVLSWNIPTYFSFEYCLKSKWIHSWGWIILFVFIGVW